MGIISHPSLEYYRNIKKFDDLKWDNLNPSDLTSFVSVIIPSFDSDNTLPTALGSLKKQTLQNISIIIVNDGQPRSLDNLFSNNTEIRDLIVNQGTYGARNYGLKYSTAEFITVHDADDWSHPQKLELQVKALIDNPNSVASVSHWARCNSDMEFETRPDGSIVHRNVSSLMVRREVINRLGYWDRVSINADTEYYYRILSAYGPDSIVEVLPGVPLALGRRHEKSLTMQPDTHWKTQFGGVRKEYMEAAHAWHQECVKTNDWFMPYAPKKRHFPVPELIERSVIELGDRVWPYIRGQQTVSTDIPSVLLCGHASGEQRFGAERSLFDLAKAIYQLGYRLIITLPQRNASYIDSLKPWCSDIVLLPNPWQQDEEIWPIALDAYSRIIAHFNVDAVHVNTLVNRVPLLSARQQGIKTILHVRELLEWDTELRQSIDSYFDIKNLLDADLVLANSEYTAECILKTGFNGNLKTVVNTAELKCVWRARSFIQGELIRIGMVSSNLPKKGLKDFLAIASAAKELNLPLQFVLIGPINEHVKAIERDLPDNISVLGYCNTPEQAFVHLDILLSLSHFQESFGRTVAEAMLAAKPVICYRWGALPELVENGSNGFLVHFRDIDGVVQRLNYLCNHPELIEELGRYGQMIAISRFSPEAFKHRLSDAYLSILPKAK